MLLVDEATAALDVGTAYRVSNAVLSLKASRALLLRILSTKNLLKQYDGILALKNGSIVESGTFDELIAEKGYVYSLFTIPQ